MTVCAPAPHYSTTNPTPRSATVLSLTTAVLAGGSECLHTPQQDFNAGQACLGSPVRSEAGSYDMHPQALTAFLISGILRSIARS